MNIDYRIFTQKLELDKAINTLIGLLKGIAFDNKINQEELLELNSFIIENELLFSKHPFLELINRCKKIHQSEYLEETIEDLIWTCNSIRTEYFDFVTTDMQILQGICHGILADGIIEDDEVHNLSKWIDEHEHLTNLFPYDELSTFLLSILKDNIIDEDERLRLKAFLNQIVSLKNDSIAEKVNYEVKDVAVSGVCTSNPNINFDNKTFCFTGDSHRVSRPEFEMLVKEMGSHFKKGVSLNVDYLIVGSLGNECWAFSCYGRKVESAIKIRKKGHHISIIHENDFWDIYEDIKAS